MGNVSDAQVTVVGRCQQGNNASMSYFLALSLGFPVGSLRFCGVPVCQKHLNAGKPVSSCPLCWVAAYPESCFPCGWQGSESFEGSAKGCWADQLQWGQSKVILSIFEGCSSPVAEKNETSLINPGEIFKNIQPLLHQII